MILRMLIDFLIHGLELSDKSNMYAQYVCSMQFTESAWTNKGENYWVVPADEYIKNIQHVL